MNWLRFGTLAAGSLNTTILLGLITVYLLLTKRKAKDTWFLACYLGVLFILLLSYTIRYSLFSTVGLATAQLSNVIVFGVPCLIQFAYAYRKNSFRRESILVGIITFTAAGAVWCSLFFVPSVEEIYDFKAQYFTKVYDARISVLVLLFYVWAVVVFIRKIIRFSIIAGNTAVRPLKALRFLLRPAGRDALSTRSFTFLSLATTAISLLYLLFQTGVMSRETYAFLFNIGSLLTCLIIFVVYVNNAPQPISFVTKLVGIPLAVILVAFGVASATLMPLVHSTLGSRYRDDVNIAQLVLDSGGPGQVPPSIAFMLPEGNAMNMIAYMADDIEAEWAERITGEHDNWPEGLIPEQNGIRPVFMYMDIRNTDSFFFSYRLETRRSIYFIGFRYSLYRLEVHRFASRIILGVLIAAALVILGFPVAFQRGLMRPLDRLSRAVSQVSSGYYRVRLPEGVSDEVGELTRGFNIMASSLENAEGNFKALAENANDAILLLSPDGRLLYANLRASRISGYSVEELNGTHFTKLLHKDEIGPVSDRFSDSLPTGRNVRAYETRILKKDGLEVSVEVSAAATVWQGEPADVVLFRDITERKRAEEELQAQQQQLLRTDKLASLGALVAGMAHEINNPNQAIAMNARFFSSALKALLPLAESGEVIDDTIQVAGLDYGDFKVEANSSLAEIEASTQRIDHIVKELKRFVQGGSAAKIEPIDLNTVVNTVIDLFRHIINQATNHFATRLATDLPRVRGDRIGLEQVVLNLLQNACQALPSRDRAVEIKTLFDSKSNTVSLEVSDEGIGISRDNQKKVTDSFFTTKSDYGGTGLGLSVSKRIISEHSGSLEIESAENRGTTVRVRIPVG